MPKLLVLGADLTGGNAAGGQPGYPPRFATTRRAGGADEPPAREASVVTVACLEDLNPVPATGRKNP
jgi:hypothetical protein